MLPARRRDRRNGIAIGVAVVAVVLVAMVASGGRVPLATEGEGGWDLFIPSLQPQTVETVPTTRPTVVGEPTNAPGIGAFALLSKSS